MDGDELAGLEAEMAAERAEAGTRLRAAAGWLAGADRALSGLTRPTWGGPVDDWHRARDALNDALETCAAYEEFPPLD
jgi:hypothetical protein